MSSKWQSEAVIYAVWYMGTGIGEEHNVFVLWLILLSYLGDICTMFLQNRIFTYQTITLCHNPEYHHVSNMSFAITDLISTSLKLVAIVIKNVVSSCVLNLWCHHFLTTKCRLMKWHIPSHEFKYGLGFEAHS
jgi:hypothetical protein